MKTKKMILLVLVVIALMVVSSGVSVTFAEDIKQTFVGEDSLEVYVLHTPANRVKSIYRQGADKAIILYPDLICVPIGSGDSMLPMVTKGHLVLVTKSYEPSEICLGDFIVVDGAFGRYFHQVVDVRKSENGLIFTTKGLSNDKDDIAPVFEEDIVGIAIAVIW